MNSKWLSFFANHADAQEIKIEADWALNKSMVVNLFPEVGHGDGF